MKKEIGEWVSPTLAAREVGVDRWTIYKWVKSGSVKSRKRAGSFLRGIRVKLEDVRALAADMPVR